MENWTKQLELLSEKVKNLLGAFHSLKSENDTLKSEINHLKVEIGQLRTQELNINTKQADREQTVSTHSVNESDTRSGISDEMKHKNLENTRLRTQIDEIIEDLDRCIQIIQTTSDGK